MGALRQIWVRWTVATVGGTALAVALLLGLSVMMRLDAFSGPKSKVLVARKAKPASLGRTSRMNFVALPSPRALPALVPRDLLPQPAAALPKPEPEKPDDGIPNGQIVQNVRPDAERAPKQSNYLSRYDVAVQREQKARSHQRTSADLGKVKVDEASQFQSPLSKSTAPTTIAGRAAKTRDKQLEVAEVPKVEASRDNGQGPAPREEQQGRKGSSVVLKGADSGLLLPSTSPGNILHNLQALSGSSGSRDYLPDVAEEGETNLLNSRRFRFWDYFDRAGDKVERNWEPGKVMHNHDPTGQKYGMRNRYTVLAVRLDTEGSLKDAKVTRGCGLDFLDEEALRAFAAASPFPNPPAGLKNARGEVEFQFGFMFEMSSQRFKMGGWQ